MLIKLLFSLFEHSPVSFLIGIAVLILPLLFSITIHEWSHGMVAYLFGDPTPKNQGRLTLNPFAHLDPIGTLMLFIIGIGWAKPVVIDTRNINGRTKQMLVALAGPASNFLVAIIFSFIFYFLTVYIHSINLDTESTFSGEIMGLLSFIIQINIMLGLFNMLPIPPLDGSNVLKWVLPDFLSNAYEKLAPYGIFILMLMLFTVGFKFIVLASEIVQNCIFETISYIFRPFFGV